MDRSSPWHEDPAFWETVREYLFPPEKFEEAPEQVDRMLDLLDPDPGARVLDIPCGVGRHAAEFARRGFRVTAVDVTEAYLDAARERVRETGEDEDAPDEDGAGDGGAVSRNLELERADMREFRRPEAFDAVVNVYTSFGYFEDRADDERTARNFYESLRPGGRLLLSLASKEVLAGTFEKRTWSERDGAYVLEEHEVTDDWNWMENRWIVVEDGEETEFRVSHRLYSAYELTALLEDVGFERVAVYDDLDGSAYDENAERLVAVAEK